MSGSPTVLPSRSTQRAVHSALAVALGMFVYSPLSDAAAAELAVQVVVFPALALSGVLMWQGHRLRRWRTSG